MADREEVKSRFANAKDLLTMIIGVLGTVVGFYFGLQTDVTSMGITNVALSTPFAKSNDKVTMIGQIVGGRGPYQVRIEFYDPAKVVNAAQMNKEDKTETGFISSLIEMPDVSHPLLYSSKSPHKIPEGPKYNRLAISLFSQHNPHNSFALPAGPRHCS
jgi:hypothetical protein